MVGSRRKRSSPPCAPGATDSLLPVLDTSAVVAVLMGDHPSRQLAARVSGGDLHAPHLVDVEFTHVVRRLVASGRVTIERANGLRADFADLPIIRYPHGPLLDRMWQLRDNLSAYDAAFVALSEALDLPLVTVDARLAASPGHNATVEAY